MTEQSKARSMLGKVPGVHALSGGTDRLVAAQQQRLDAMQRTLDAYESSMQKWLAMEQHLPNVLNAIASHHGTQRRLRRQIDEVQADLQRQLDSVDRQLASHQSQIGDVHLRFDDPETGVGAAVTALWDRIEMVRRELLFELRYSSGAARPGGAADDERSQVEPEVLDPAKLAAMEADTLRVNLGCGHIPLDGYLNIDMRAIPGVDMVASVEDLPFEPGAVEEIFSSHVLEHFPVEQLRRQLLPYWVGLLRAGGTFRAVVPDAEAMVRRFEAGEMPFEQFREVFFGGQEYEGDFHFNMFTVESLAELLREAGLDDVVVEASDRANGLCYEFQIAATRPG